MSRETDPLWQALTVLETDYSDYGGRVVRWQDPKQSDEDCSCGCKHARYLDGSGDWLVCTNPKGPRHGMLTWEHQAGRGCFDWACYQCGETECECVDGEVSCEACQATMGEAEARHAGSKWHHLTRHRGGELVRDLWMCERCNDHVVKIAVERPEDQRWTVEIERGSVPLSGQFDERFAPPWAEYVVMTGDEIVFCRRLSEAAEAWRKRKALGQSPGCYQVACVAETLS